MSHRRTASQRGLANHSSMSLHQHQQFYPQLTAIPSSPAPALPPSPYMNPDSPSLPTFAPPSKSQFHHGWSSGTAAATASTTSLLPFPKGVRRRTTWLALLGLGALCIYVFYLSGSSSALATIPLRGAYMPGPGAPPPAHVPADGESSDTNERQPGRGPHRSSSWRKAAAGKARPQIALSAEEELAAITSFLAALPEHRIPHNVDPAKPIDPQVILDFDTRGDGARDELDEIVHDVWKRNPVVLFSKFYSPAARELKTILSGMRLAPAPEVFEVDQRPDADVLTPLLYRLTSATEFPILLVGGHPVGSIEEIRMLHKDGKLRKLIEEAGAKYDGQKKKGGRKH